MKELTFEEFIKFDYLKDISKLILNKVKNGVLTDEAVLELLKDRENLFWLYGFAYADVSNIDLSKLSYDVFTLIPFSTHTKFPTKNKLPNFFDPEKYINQAMNSCYRFDVCDKNCKIAIIDNPTQFYLHEQFKDLNCEIIDYSKENTETHFHADGVLGNIASKNFGYGHDAKYLIYVVDWDSSESRLESHLKALEDVYKRIQNEEKIQVVSISNMLIDRELEQTKTAKRINEMVEILSNNPYYRCEVVDSIKFSSSGFQPIYINSLDDVCKDNYKYSYYSEKNRFGIPINKIEPLFSTTNGYKLTTNSISVSWAIPILSYFYAVCRQYKDFSFDDYVKFCKNNFITNNNNVQIVDFELIIKKIKDKQKNIYNTITEDKTL